MGGKVAVEHGVKQLVVAGVLDHRCTEGYSQLRAPTQVDGRGRSHGIDDFHRGHCRTSGLKRPAQADDPLSNCIAAQRLR